MRFGRTSVRDTLFGPWRAVMVLSLTQILAWGAIYYTPVLMVPLIAAERTSDLTAIALTGALVAASCICFLLIRARHLPRINVNE